MTSYYTPEQAAEQIGVSTRTLTKWRSEGKFVPAKRTVGGHSRYSQEQIDSLINVPKKVESNLEELMG